MSPSFPMHMEDHSIEDNATGDFRMKELKSSDHAAMCQDPCRRESLTSENQTSSDAELPMALFEAPLSLEISPAARPQSVDFSNKSDDIESEIIITNQEYVREEDNLIEISDEVASDTNNDHESGCGFSELSAELPLSLAAPEISQSDFSEHGITEISTEAEDSLLMQKGFSHYEESPSPSKEKQPRRRGRKPFLKAAAKGRKLISRMFSRRKSAQ